MIRLMRAVATAAGVGSLIACWVASSLNELDEALSEYLVEQPPVIPDTVPLWMDEEADLP